MTAPQPSRDAPFRTIQVDSLAFLKILRHCTTASPTVATGSLLGMDVPGTLQVTDTFPYPLPEHTETHEPYNREPHPPTGLAAAAPRSKANAEYQANMLRLLRDVNTDANNVGWYMSTRGGDFVTANLIENQYFFQKEMGEKTVCIVCDIGPGSSTSRADSKLKAFRLSKQFMEMYKEGPAKFNTETLQKSSFSAKDILIELPINIHNSQMATTLLHQLPSPPPTRPLTQPTSLTELTAKMSQPTPATSSILTASPSIPLLHSTSLLLDALESHTTDQNNASYYQRSLAREQVKISAWQAKRKAENAARVASKQDVLPEDEWTRLFKLPTEPSRLDGLLIGRQVEQYGRVVDEGNAVGSANLFARAGGVLQQGQ